MTAALKALLLLGIGLSTARAAASWQLMSRHGECASLDNLRRRLPELDSIADSPQAFAEQLRRRGYAVQAERLADASLGGELWSVTVPVKDLALLFATSEACAAMAGQTR